MSPVSMYGGPVVTSRNESALRKAGLLTSQVYIKSEPVEIFRSDEVRCSSHECGLPPYPVISGLATVQDLPVPRAGTGKIGISGIPERI